MSLLSDTETVADSEVERLSWDWWLVPGEAPHLPGFFGGVGHLRMSTDHHGRASCPQKSQVINQNVNHSSVNVESNPLRGCFLCFLLKGTEAPERILSPEGLKSWFGDYPVGRDVTSVSDHRWGLQPQPEGGRWRGHGEQKEPECLDQLLMDKRRNFHQFMWKQQKKRENWTSEIQFVKNFVVKSPHYCVQKCLNY